MTGDTIYVKLSNTLHEELSGGSWAQAPGTCDLFDRIARGETLTRDEAESVWDGLDTGLEGMEAVRDGGSMDFEEAGRLHAAIRSGVALERKLAAFLGIAGRAG